MSSPAQAAKEREVFLSFAGVAPLDIDVASIQSRSPPDPDILCRTHGKNELRFELTELIDRAHMERVAMMGNTSRALKEYYESTLPPAEKARFDELYRRALLYFEFDPSASLHQRKLRFPPAFDILLKCRESMSEFTLKNDPDLVPELRKIRVKKIQWNGPTFDTNGFGWLSDPTEESIKKKLNKTYAGGTEIELLAYIDWDLLPPEGAWKAAADRAVACMEGSFISRVWVVNVNTKEILYVYPPEECAT